MNNNIPKRKRKNLREASVYAGVPVNTLRWYRQCDTGPVSYRVGARVFYDVDDLDDWIEAEKAKSMRGGK